MDSALKSHTLSVSLMHLDVILHSHARMNISHALALFWKVTLLFWLSEVLIKYNHTILSFALHRRSKCAWF